MLDLRYANDVNYHSNVLKILESIDKKLLDLSLLTEQEINWWNNYHQMVWQDLSPLLQGSDLEWLKEATAPINK